MKRFVEITVDFLLFCFLLIIFLVPLLVSFNLDPKLHQYTSPTVAGVVNNKYLENFHINETFNSNNTYIANGVKIGNRYSLRYTHTPENDATFQIGNIQNDNNENVNFSVNLYSRKQLLKGVVISLLIDDMDFELFNGEEFNEAEFSLSSETTSDIALGIRADRSIYYNIDLIFEIRNITNQE